MREVIEAYADIQARTADVMLFSGAGLAKLEEQGPVAVASRGHHAFWVKWTEAAAGLYGPGIKLYVAPVAQAGRVPEDVMHDAQRYRWLRGRSRQVHGTAWFGGFQADKFGSDFFSDEEAIAALEAGIDAALSAATAR